MAYAGDGQHQDAGAKVHHLAPNTTSNILSKSISKNGGRSSYRGMLQVMPKAADAGQSVSVMHLFLMNIRSDTYPTMEIGNSTADLEHEASVSKVSGDQLFYLMSRGLPKKKQWGSSSTDSFEPFTRELPMEYAVELNKLWNWKWRVRLDESTSNGSPFHVRLICGGTPLGNRIHPTKVDELPDVDVNLSVEGHDEDLHRS